MKSSTCFSDTSPSSESTQHSPIRDMPIHGIRTWKFWKKISDLGVYAFNHKPHKRRHINEFYSRICQYHITYISTFLYLQLRLFKFNIVQQNSTCPDGGYPDRLGPSGKFVREFTN